MQKFSIGILLLAVIILASSVYILIFGPNSESEIPPGPQPPKPEPVIRESVTSREAERVRSRRLKGQFLAAGTGEDSNWGIRKVMHFQYMANMAAESEILTSEILPSGCIKIVEKRAFNKVSDSLDISDIDVRLDIKTLPIEEFSLLFDFCVGFYAGASGDMTTSSVLFEGKNFVKRIAEKLDGQSIRGILADFGYEPPKVFEEYLQKFSQAKFHKAIGGIRAIEGKTYKVTWYQETSGQPMSMKFTYENGEPVVDEEECMVLKRVNAFIDSKLAPNPDCLPGDSWSIAAEEMQEVFDPYVDGTYYGQLSVTRGEDDENGNWHLVIAPGRVQVQNDTDGSQTGELDLTSGYAKVRPSDVCLQELFAEGMADLRKLSKHYLLFTAKINGKCDFQGRIICEPVESAVNSEHRTDLE